VQIAGYDPQMIADAAIACEQMGAGIIDINMGCPAKKVCKRAAGSALLQDEKLVEKILTTTVNAVSIPVTLKTRTGWSTETKNGIRIAEIAQAAGIKALTIHGRTRACKFSGHAEYDTIAEIVQKLDIPVIANGDINSAEQVKRVLDYTGAAAVMIGRAALGQPWIFHQVRNYLESAKSMTTPSLEQKLKTMREHLRDIHSFYGELQGVRIARKHIGWYLQHLENSTYSHKTFNLLPSAADQIIFIEQLESSVQIERSTPNCSKMAA
jgi:tRNA-dihydrouridine synthase B